MSTQLRRLTPLRQGDASAVAGAKAARLSAALRAGLPVLPGWVVPAAESKAAVRAAVSALRGGRFAAARRAVLCRPLDGGLTAELAEAAARLGSRVIVRSSSKLEGDPRWSGAFASVAGVLPREVATAVRSCWASAFAVDPLARLDACGLQLEDLELAALIQPEIRPAAGGVARVTPADGHVDITVEGVAGHPGPLLHGYSDGAPAFVTVAASGGGDCGQKRLSQQPFLTKIRAGDAAVADGPLLDLVGRHVVLEVARVAADVHRLLGDDAIEWAVADGRVWLLQCRRTGEQRTAAAAHATDAAQSGVAAHTGAGPGPELAGREWMPVLGAAVRARGHRLRARPAVAGEAAGRLVACRSHERPPAAWRDAILLIDRPLPAFAPLLFTARGVIARSGPAGSHLAEVARSLSVPMVTGCRPEAVTGVSPACPGWLAAIDGSTGDVALCRGDGGGHDRREARYG
jgi:pyruvate, water dikinase